MGELVDLVDSNGTVEEWAIPIEDANAYYPYGLHLQVAVAVVFDSARRVLVQRRALSKKSDPGHIDHVCGVVASGEDPVQTAFRESIEETGVQPESLQLVNKGVNSYRRYRYLFVGSASQSVGEVDPYEVEWAKFVSRQNLRVWRNLGMYPFVGEFFEDLELATDN